MPTKFLSHADLGTVARLTVLVAIDLIIRNGRDEVLLGLRNNEPAKGCYFVPGGMVMKNERLAEAFTRLVKSETDHNASFTEARLLGAFEHFYDTNRSGDAGYGTHYVVLGYEFKMVRCRRTESRRPAQRTALVACGRAVGIGSCA